MSSCRSASGATTAGRRFFAGALQDISERKRLEEELARTRRLESVGRVAAGFAHDFNNLLTVLAGNLELILQSTSDDSIRDLARPALEAAETGALLNRRLLSLRKRRRRAARPVNLNDRIIESFGLIQRAVGEQISSSTRPRGGPVAGCRRCGGNRQRGAQPRFEFAGRHASGRRNPDSNPQSEHRRDARPRPSGPACGGLCLPCRDRQWRGNAGRCSPARP